MARVIGGYGPFFIYTVCVAVLTRIFIWFGGFTGGPYVFWHPIMCCLLLGAK